MKRAACVLACVALPALAQGPRVALDNERVRVLTPHIAPGAELAMHEHPARVIIALSPVKIRQTLADGTSSEVAAEAGSARFAPPVQHAVLNLAKSALDAVEVEIKPLAQEHRVWLRDAAAADPGHFTILVDNDRVRVLRFRLVPRETSPMHPHGDRVSVSLTDARLRLKRPDGSVEESRRKKGETAFRTAGEHSVENVGNSVYESISVELKYAPGAAPAPDPGLKHVQVAGADLAYLEKGTGTPVVLVPGFASDYRAWAAQFELYAAHHRVIALSPRHRYPNPGGDGSDAGFEREAADLTALLRQLNLASVHLVGHDEGGVVAFLVARERPNLVRSLTLAEPTLDWLYHDQPEGEGLVEKEIARRSAAREKLAAGDLEGAIRIATATALGPGELDKQGEATLAMYLDNASAVAGWASAAPPLASVTCDDARDIAAPTLVLLGEKSPQRWRLITDALAKCLYRRRRIEVPGSSHNLPAERPDAFNDIAVPFVDEVEGRPVDR